MKNLSKTLLSLAVSAGFIALAIGSGSADYSQSSGGYSSPSSSSSSSSVNCRVSSWMEYRSGRYYCKFSKNCNKSVTIHYKVSFPDGSTDNNGMEYMMSSMRETTGRSYTEKGTIYITREDWGE